LRVAVSEGRQSAQNWKLEIRDDVTEEQKGHLRGWLGQASQFTANGLR